MQSEKLLVDLNSVIEQLENEWGYEGIREDLYKLPTVDAVEVVHGRWERRVVDWSAPYSWKVECSNCGFYICGLGDAYLFKYCPNCGAKMDGGNEDG